jgi:hypothetical protein
MLYRITSSLEYPVLFCIYHWLLYPWRLAVWICLVTTGLAEHSHFGGIFIFFANDLSPDRLRFSPELAWKSCIQQISGFSTTLRHYERCTLSA